MTPELRANIECLPSYFESHFSAKEKWYVHSKQFLIGLGAPLEEVVMAEWEAGNVVTGNIHMGRKGRGEALDIHPIDREPVLLSSLSIIDFGKDGLYVWDSDAHKLKRSLFGEQPVRDQDVAHFFEARAEGRKDVPIVGLQEGASIGTFMEQYHVGQLFEDIEETDDTERFIGDMDRVLLDQELYFGLERFMRRKGLLKPN